MSKFSANVINFTPVLVADSANFTDAGYHAVQGGASTQVNKIMEIALTGIATSSANGNIIIARDSTVGASSLSGARLAALDPATAALAAPPVTFTTSTTKPQRSSTLSILNMSFNAFGGIFRWVAAPGEEIGMLGSTASTGEISISSSTSGTPGLIGSHVVFEPA